MERAANIARYGEYPARGAAAVIICPIPAPVPLLVRFEGLRAAFPGWDITVARSGTKQWFEATWPGYTGPGHSTLIAGSTHGLWQALSAECTPAGRSRALPSCPRPVHHHGEWCGR
jgi:hypothetical protein